MTTPERLTPEQLEFAARCAPRGPQAYPSADGSIVEIDFQAMLRQAARDARTLQALRERLENTRDTRVAHELAGYGSASESSVLTYVLAWLDDLERQP